MNNLSEALNFLNNDSAEENTACVILHLREDKSFDVAAFFCEAVNKRRGLTMKFDVENGKNRVILTGSFEVVYDVLREYQSR